ncbi:type II toxin-antitoxin system CcdA family antitoxin [Sphingomonas bacterium]|uniref:type II toxin-antitoxin system CcdA family antitoxin n=1 Tax=Sphingomonas bacterium TaxID=1895847 RepID=UPI00157572E8|nr:type II toxin-antitoxin system CcdA family antitoxin [Sphingomonas bacterium]
MREPVSTRQRVNLLLDRKTVEAVRELGLKLSRTVDRVLAREVKTAREQHWREENREPLATWADWYDREGDPLAHLPPL